MSTFVEHLQEVFIDFGEIQAKRMFGGYGIYYQGIMFGLVADDFLYLKADSETAQYFEQLGLRRFEYDNGKKIIALSYYLAPDDIFDDPEVAATWARRAYQVAVRSKMKSKTTTRKKRRQNLK